MMAFIEALRNVGWSGWTLSLAVVIGAVLFWALVAWFAGILPRPRRLRKNE